MALAVRCPLCFARAAPTLAFRPRSVVGQANEAAGRNYEA